MDLTPVSKRVLTLDNSIPEGYTFLIDAVIYVWNPHHHFQRLRIPSAELERQCIEYLRNSKRAFDSLEHAKTVIIAEKWSNWDRLLKPHDDDVYFPEGV